MFKTVTVNKMLGNLEGQLGEDDYTEPLNILINSANKNNIFNLFIIYLIETIFMNWRFYA